ncbi:Cell wall surface anchor family protein [Rhodotorula toruloides]|nr:Cell wall surface anchor family protein [Rhodotorula toruloides]
MPDAATQTDALDWRVAQVPRGVLAPDPGSDLNEVDEEVSSGKATEPAARRSGPASLLNLPDELLEQIYQELYRQLSIDRKSLSYRCQRLMPSTSSILVSKRIYDIGRAIWFADWSDVDGRTRALLLMHIENYAPYVKSWSSFVPDDSADLDFVLLASPVPWRSVHRLTLGDDNKSSPSDHDMRRNLVEPLNRLLKQKPRLVLPLVDLSIRFHEIRRNYNAIRTGEILCEDLSKILAVVSCFPDAVHLVLSQSQRDEYNEDDEDPLNTQGDQSAVLLEGLRPTRIVHLRVSGSGGITTWRRTSSEEDFVVQLE